MTQLQRSRLSLLLFISALFVLLEGTQRAMSGVCIFADWGSFGESLAAGFISGLLYSAIVAYFVVIWFDRERVRREIVAVRHGLNFRLDRPSSWNGFGAMDCAPPGVLAVSELLDKYPIDLWLARVPEEATLIKALTDFTSAAATFVTRATQVESAIDQGVRTAIAASGIIPSYQDVVTNRALYIYYLRGRVEQCGEDLAGLPVVATSINGHGVVFDQYVSHVQATQEAMVNLLQAANICRARINAIRELLHQHGASLRRR